VTATDALVANAERRLDLTATIFGVEWSSSLPLVGFEDRHDAAAGTATVRPISSKQLRDLWRGNAETIVCRRQRNGRPMLVVERSRRAYRVRAPRYGDHIVSEDGRSVACVVPRHGDWRWQRLLYAQSLPLAAQLQGLNVLHASAVRVQDACVAFVAPAGTGKSTLAANLVAHGHRFLTDDVLAVSVARTGLMAHSGPALLGLADAEYERLSSVARGTLGAAIGRLDKLYLATKPEPAPTPLHMVFFLSRQGTGELEIREQRPPKPAQLLGSAFLSYLQTQVRLVKHLEFCAALARSARVFTVEAPLALRPDQLAAELERHILRHTEGS
jgi:hypothetical protein